MNGRLADTDETLTSSTGGSSTVTPAANSPQVAEETAL